VSLFGRSMLVMPPVEDDERLEQLVVLLDLLSELEAFVEDVLRVGYFQFADVAVYLLKSGILLYYEARISA